MGLKRFKTQGTVLRMIRDHLGLSQRVMAFKMGLSRESGGQLVSNAERGLAALPSQHMGPFLQKYCTDSKYESYVRAVLHDYENELNRKLKKR